MPSMPVLGRNAPIALEARRPDGPDPVLTGLADGMQAIAGGFGELHHANVAQDASAYALGDAERQTAMGQAYLEAQGKAGAGGAGFTDAIGQQFERIYGGAEMPRDPTLRQRAQAQLAADRARYLGQAQTWEAQQRGIATADNVDRAGNIYASGLASTIPTGDVAGARAALASTRSKFGTMMAGVAGLNPDAVVKITREQDAGFATSAVNGLIDKGDLATARGLIDSEDLASLDPTRLQALRGRIDVAERRAEAEARATVAQAKAELRQRNATALATLQAGRGTPDDWTALAASMEAAGDGDGAVRARAQATEIGAAEGHRGDTPVERQAIIDDLRARPTLDAEQGARLRGLEGQQSYVQRLPTLSRYTYATGKAVAPIDWNDPGSIAARATVVAAANARFGGDAQFLQPGEEEPLRQMIAGQRGDRVQAAHTILQAGRYAGKLLDQVAGDDREFRSSIALAALPNGGALMDRALRGRDALKASPKLLERPSVGGAPQGRTFDETISADAARATALLPPEYRAAIVDNTRNLYLATAGENGWSFFHEGEAQRQLRVALGGVETGTGWKGGLGTHNGAAVVLPRGMAQDEFDRRLARTRGVDWAKASLTPGDDPWTGDRAMTAGELRGLVPVMIGDGRYALRQGNSYITTKGGRRFEFDVRRLPGGG